MTEPLWPASRRQIDLAGERLRDWWFDFELSHDLVITDPVLAAAGGLFVDFREGFQVPLSKTAMGLRSFLRSERAPVIVSQRLKRAPTILNKLGRYPAMKYSRMEDIGGCRAILPGRSEVEGVARRIRRNWEVARLRNYVQDPKATGYRAVHVVVRRDGRLIEIQLRTPGQQSWAEEVDRIASRLGAHVKDDGGPPTLARFMWLLAERRELRETSGSAETFVHEDEFRALWPQVREYF